VKRLRSYAPLGDGSLWSQCSKDYQLAADEIERLTAERDEYASGIAAGMNREHALQAELAAQVVAMREILERRDAEWRNSEDGPGSLVFERIDTTTFASLLRERDAKVAAEEREACIKAAEDAYIKGLGSKGLIDAIRARMAGGDHNRKFIGIGHLEEAGYIPEGSAAERRAGK
jgi:hypothetical protein